MPCGFVFGYDALCDHGINNGHGSAISVLGIFILAFFSGIHHAFDIGPDFGLQAGIVFAMVF